MRNDQLTFLCLIGFAISAGAPAMDEPLPLSVVMKSGPQSFDPADPAREQFKEKLLAAFRYEIQSDRTGSWPVLSQFLAPMAGPQVRAPDYLLLRKAMAEFQSVGLANATGYEEYPRKASEKFTAVERVPAIVRGDLTETNNRTKVSEEQRRGEFNTYVINLDIATQYALPTLLALRDDDKNKFVEILSARLLYLIRTIRYLDASAEEGLDACLIHAAWTESGDVRQILDEQKQRVLLLYKLRDREPENDIKALDELIELHSAVVKNGLVHALTLFDFKYSGLSKGTTGNLIVMNYGVLFSEFAFDRPAAEKLMTQCLLSFSEQYNKLKAGDPARDALRSRAELIYIAYQEHVDGKDDIAEKVLGKRPRTFVGGTVDPTIENPDWLEGRK